MGTGTILIAEDERGVRELAREFLSLSGYTVLEARDGRGSHRHRRKSRRSHRSADHRRDDAAHGRPRTGRAHGGVAARHQDFFMSGYAEYVPAQSEADEKSQWLTKPFTRVALTRKAGEILKPAAS